MPDNPPASIAIQQMRHLASPFRRTELSPGSVWSLPAFVRAPEPFTWETRKTQAEPAVLLSQGWKTRARAERCPIY